MLEVLVTLLLISCGTGSVVPQAPFQNRIFLPFPIVKNDSCDISSFPTSFKFGAGSSAYQIEGGWNVDGKSRSWWDWFANTYLLTSGNVADDSYHKYKEDVAAIKKIGLDYYRFSIAWTRILPKGFSNQIDPAGVKYYNNLIDELIAAGIEPLVTIYHWDIPLTLSFFGDWTNSKIVDYFVEFADLAFRLFGDRVKVWATINEPKSFCEAIPTLLQLALFPELPIGTYEYLCGHYALLAHAKAYRLYEKKYKKTQNGKVGIILDIGYNIPLTNSTADKKAVERAYLFDFGWLANPIVYGDYPQALKDIIAKNSASQNFSTSRLPSFSLTEKAILRGSYDVIMVNSYVNYLVTLAPYNNTPAWVNDKQIITSFEPDWPLTNVGFAVNPPGIRGILNHIKDNYGSPEIYITENGLSDTGGLNDTDRIDYIQDVLEQIRLAICEDKVKITRYTYWSLLDSLEWTSGFTAKFGLVNIDYNSTNLTRTLKQSAYYYRNVIQTRLINATSSG